MDKHDRKRLARWESKRGKEQLKFEEQLREHSYELALRRIKRVVDEWEPTHDLLFPRAMNLLSDPGFHTLLRRNPDFSDGEITEFVRGYRWIGSRRHRFFVNEEEIASEIKEEKAWKKETRMFQLAVAMGRHQVRANAIREELLDKTTRLRAMQNCYLIKEELMMNVWHPRRVEHILTTYGWEAYENLLGEE